METDNRRMAVACLDGDGDATIFCTILTCTEDQLVHSAHLRAAQDAADNAGYDTDTAVVIADHHSDFVHMLAPVFWENVDRLDISNNPNYT